MHHMNFWVHTTGMYRATAILGRGHAAFFNYHYFSEMINISDEIVLARSMTALNLKFKSTVLPR